jgi:hypothetical protein
MSDIAWRCPTCGKPMDAFHVKLDRDSVRAIRADPRSGSVIARDYGVTKTTINLIKRRMTWKHVR